MEAKVVREWITSVAKAGVSVSKFYSSPYSHWQLVASEKARGAIPRLIEIIFLSTAVQLLFLSATYKQISTGFGLKVALLVLLQAGFLLFYFPGTLLSFKVVRPTTPPTLWHVADYVVMQSQVTILPASLCFALFYAIESYALYYVGTALTLAAGVFFIVRAGMVPSRTAGILRRMAASGVLLACQVFLGVLFAFLILVAAPLSQRSAPSPFADPIAGEVVDASLAIDKDLKELGTVPVVIKNLSALREVVAKVVLRSESGKVSLSAVDSLRSVQSDVLVVLRTDRSIVDRVAPQLGEMKNSSKFRTTKEIARQTEVALASYSRFLDGTELYFNNNREMITVLGGISDFDASTSIKMLRKPTEQELDRLIHEVDRLNQLLKDGIALVNIGNAADKEMTAAFNSQIEFQKLISSARRISPLYGIEF